GRSMILEIHVARAPVELEGLEVEVERRSDYLDRIGFYERRRYGFGSFIDVEAMDVSRILTPGQLLTRLPGTSLDSNDEPYFHRAQRTDLTGERRGRCVPVIVIDGSTVRTTMQSGEDRFEDLVRATEISAIEVYRSTVQVPVEWKTGANSCGMIMIWTKH
ncbi:MAG: hypothetical protein RQ745_00695, partial [Longimicrobiales bacterium]|nr:hypothetical protein [Longimicrobiales bacterium]